MIKLFKKILAAVSISLVLLATVQAAPSLKLPEIDAESYLLIDFNSQRVLASKNPEKRVEPASITKLMTAYIIYNELKR